MSNKKLISKIAKKELIKRDNIVEIDILESAFQQQLDFINDTAKRKVACSSRRAGKSSAVGLYLVNECLKNPRTNCLYISRTKESAENIMWNDIFDVILKKYDIDAKPGASKLQIKFSNGSHLYLTGADASVTQMRALVGKKYSLVVIDECQNFVNDLDMLVNKILMPTLGDLNATICMIGTPGQNMTDASYWYKVVKGNEPGWSRHEWHWSQNPHVRDNIQKQVDEMTKANPLILSTPWFRMEYNNEWLIQSDNRVYKSTNKNYIESIAEQFFKGCSYNLSLDLGYHDATAFVVSAYNKHFDNNLYIIESNKQSKLTITAVANIIKQYMVKYKFYNIVIDAANTQAVEEMRQIHLLPLIAADKQGKNAHIECLNSDLITENIFIVKSTNQDLIKELETLVWDEKALLSGKYKENAMKDNHLCDSFLYGFFHSRHYWWKEPAPIISEEDQFQQLIEQQFYKPKMKTLKKAWYDQ